MANLKYGVIPDRLLPSRSFISFYFPSTNGNPTQIRLPFFENLNITESKAARLQEFKLLGRSSNLYGYLGADSRKFSVTFKMNLTHILEEYPDSYSLILNNVPNLNLTSNQNTVGNFIKNEASILSEKFTNDLSGITNLYQNNEARNNKNKIIDLMMFYTNLVRASVVNNAKNPVLGPPIIRLNHGILYQDIPCVCKDYSFEIKEDVLYDVRTLMPVILGIKLSLEEVRTGDFTNFEKGKLIKRDNLAGYEALFDQGSMEPGIVDLGK